jgi:DNA replication protein DnaC
MPRALEMLDATLRGIEQGKIDGVEAIDILLSEELSLRENRRIKAALRMARLPIIKTLDGYDFSFQPSLDRNRILALAGLDFINRAEVVHLLGPPGTGKSHIATALAVEAVKAGKSVYFIPLADLIAAAPPCSSSTRSDISLSRQAAATCSSSSSTPDTKRAA